MPINIKDMESMEGNFDVSGTRKSYNRYQNEKSSRFCTKNLVRRHFSSALLPSQWLKCTNHSFVISPTLSDKLRCNSYDQRFGQDKNKVHHLKEYLWNWRKIFVFATKLFVTLFWYFSLQNLDFVSNLCFVMLRTETEPTRLAGTHFYVYSFLYLLVDMHVMKQEAWTGNHTKHTEHKAAKRMHVYYIDWYLHRLVPKGTVVKSANIIRLS